MNNDNNNLILLTIKGSELSIAVCSDFEVSGALGHGIVREIKGEEHLLEQKLSVKIVRVC